MEQQQFNTASSVSFLPSFIEDVQHVYLISQDWDVSNDRFGNQIVLEPDGTIRCLTLPHIYFGLDDEIVVHNIICEPGTHIRLRNVE